MATTLSATLSHIDKFGKAHFKLADGKSIKCTLSPKGMPREYVETFYAKDLRITVQETQRTFISQLAHNKGEQICATIYYLKSIREI